MRASFLISLFIVVVVSHVPLSLAENSIPWNSGEITVTIHYSQETTVLTSSTSSIRFSLLDDRENILAQIEQLREQSKTELEPLVKQYMQTAGALTQLAGKVGAAQPTPQTQAQLVNVFKTTEQNIATVLEHYRTLIDAHIQQHTVKTLTLSDPTVNGQFGNVAPGKYRIYGVMTFTTTTLRWFEPIVVKGGDRPAVNLTRNNLMNPYWTDFNWWSFMNLDFSKHH